jgi:hypothetical protein
MMTQPGHCCEKCCKNPDHDHKENIISRKANEELNGS